MPAARLTGVASLSMLQYVSDAASSPGSQVPTTTPTGQGSYTVQPGDCMESIAYANGFLWQTLWNLPENATLQSQRQANVLLPGDKVTIPPLRPRIEEAGVDAKHTYVRNGLPSSFQIRFLDEEQQPRSGLQYILTIDGQTSNGTLDGDGGLTVPIMPNASSGSIQLQVDPDPETYPLNFGCLDPDASATGVRGRLNNLGFSCAASGDWDQDLSGALGRFQSSRNLPPTGSLDSATQQALKQDHQS